MWKLNNIRKEWDTMERKGFHGKSDLLQFLRLKKVLFSEVNKNQEIIQKTFEHSWLDTYQYPFRLTRVIHHVSSKNLIFLKFCQFLFWNFFLSKSHVIVMRFEITQALQWGPHCSDSDIAEIPEMKNWSFGNEEKRAIHAWSNEGYGEAKKLRNSSLSCLDWC